MSFYFHQIALFYRKCQLHNYIGNTLFNLLVIQLTGNYFHIFYSAVYVYYESDSKFAFHLNVLVTCQKFVETFFYGFSRDVVCEAAGYSKCADSHTSSLFSTLVHM